MDLFMSYVGYVVAGVVLLFVGVLWGIQRVSGRGSLPGSHKPDGRGAASGDWVDGWTDTILATIREQGSRVDDQTVAVVKAIDSLALGIGAMQMASHQVSVALDAAQLAAHKDAEREALLLDALIAGQAKSSASIARWLETMFGGAQAPIGYEAVDDDAAELKELAQRQMSLHGLTWEEALKRAREIKTYRPGGMSARA